MNTDLLAVALLAGAANWAFRVLPTLARTDRLTPGGLLERFLSATGPAAIATLFVAAVLPELSAGKGWPLPFVVGTLVVLAAWGATRSVVIATLAGAVLHGATVWALG
ncbi:AzlD domain-containing protein [Tabrizicola sp. YIM 78059]|uniref:AzlD domain-containing protein n=1 Tax=Tabrizicola sp. YIM 78059 TaxID=2529861 RepID=UPI0010AB3C85|nr:AzlD domain-containing protein [Tabrizicola sp. YIM 78059]